MLRACQPAARWLMTQLLLRALPESSNLINGFRHVRDITPAAPPCPGGARARQGGCSCHRQGNGRLARQMCAHQGQMRAGTSRLCANLHVGSGTWSPRSVSLPSCRASATCLPWPRESHQEQVRTTPPTWCLLRFLPAVRKWKHLDPGAGGKESFVFPLIGSKGRSQRVNGVFSAQMYKRKNIY